ncbi:helix-turn-helix domain-containing protein [Aneurinibacillus thermoaerophilus]|uniref:Helix-turn-helix transcriptional regulator n=1 Tax=Aneurinibacillus thermoaerophilus TaxID=143495 RepID=A0ABX8YAF1_ANETH|nr:helix-turn-helix domain-containing protein [Aneurinibacillus thermoaerophilus]MED0675406.1 helix-turn-helix domain-containing protein [Aneurinibacillus thermoaerophilus]MED0681199.1 helix-turn-helix domain-containing protein [Aneurinibacillus thermoaerophilus]MED0735439.1 helix-turn-helix domain-containing protein [Aneurinibacillus thermoaerophilus]MED0757310.1 helix-turn-helix domain-containing protein [Aneurinibacillus thermoaerophilus]MED0761441.1 helix-turn-helix domain-containing prote
MSTQRIGEVVREIRKYLNISQTELAKGICTQALISKIEKGEVIPSAEILYYIAKRLGITLDYFFDRMENPRFTYVQEFFYQIRKLIRERNYEEVAILIKAEKNNPIFQNRKNRQFLVWHEGICAYYTEQNTQKSLDLLHQALNMAVSPDNYTEKEVEILNSIGIIYSEEKQFTKSAEIFSTAIKHMSNVTLVQDYTIYIRLFYNYAKVLTKLGNFSSSLEYCERGISLCLQHEYLYLFGELHYQKGENLFHLCNKEQAIEFFRKSIIIFELQQNNIFVDYVRKRLAEVESISK